MTDATMMCGDVDERLPDYLEETLDEPTRRRVRQHVSSCARCTSLIADLEAITVDASALPQLKPSRDLWAGIAERIETPVIALGAGDVSFRRRFPGWMVGMIAAGLVFATAGVTHVLTRQSMERQFVTSAEKAPSATAMATVREPNKDSVVPGTGVVQNASATPKAPAKAPAPTVREGRQTPSATPVQFVARTAAEVTYDREITRLRGVLRERRAQLEPETVRVIEESLRVIDNAIQQSRSALAKDPASAFLRDQLDSSLEKKVDLLRTAVLLPART